MLWPLIALTAAGVKLTSPGSVLFRQERLGRGGHRFHIYKFRTMTTAETCPGCAVTANGDHRITPFGAFLRRHKLDELPQLINVLRGEMSLVGPRPEVPEFAALYPLEYARILQVRPGITHPATLSFRREEEILASAADPRQFYIEQVMPAKLVAYEERLRQSLAADMRTIIATIAPRFGAAPLGPRDFQPVVVRPVVPVPALAGRVRRQATPAKQRQQLITLEPRFAVERQRETAAV